MSNRESNINIFTVAVAAIAICAAAVLLMPAHANSDAASDAASGAAYGGPADYFPAQYVNQGQEFEPMPMMYE